jgi:hypothetical protein
MLAGAVAPKCPTEHRCAQLITANFTQGLLLEGSAVASRSERRLHLGQ